MPQEFRRSSTPDPTGLPLLPLVTCAGSYRCRYDPGEIDRTVVVIAVVEAIDDAADNSPLRLSARHRFGRI